VSGARPFSPLLHFVTSDFGGGSASNTHEVVVVPGRTRSIQLFAAAGHGVGGSSIDERLQGSIHGGERRRIIPEVGVQTLGRNELGRFRECGSDCGALLGCTNHSVSLVVVFGARDVDVVVVVFDAVFFVDFFVQLMAQLRENPLFEHDPVDERDKHDVEDDLPKHFTDDVGGVESD
jgi:hypothetical protein